MANSERHVFSMFSSIYARTCARPRAARPAGLPRPGPGPRPGAGTREARGTRGTRTRARARVNTRKHTENMPFAVRHILMTCIRRCPLRNLSFHEDPHTEGAGSAGAIVEAILDCLPPWSCDPAALHSIVARIPRLLSDSRQDSRQIGVCTIRNRRDLSSRSLLPRNRSAAASCTIARLTVAPSPTPNEPRVPFSVTLSSLDP